MLLKLDDWFSMERETPRAETTLILFAFTSVNAISIVGIINIFIGLPTLPKGKIYGMLSFVPLVVINLLLVFYKQRFKKIEEELEPIWKQKKRKYVLFTLLYVILTIALFFFSMEFARRNN